MKHHLPSQRRNSHRPTKVQERGIVLPVALIMLAIVSVAGLMAAKNSATSEQFSNNLRTSQVARNGAESALRYCERVAIFSKVADPDLDDPANADLARHIDSIPTTKLADLEVATIQSGSWNNLSNWAVDGTNLIRVPLDKDGDGDIESDDVDDTEDHDPYCLIEPAEGNQFLITARGLSRNAQIGDDGQLESGAEVWLQSILTPGRPVGSAGQNGPA